MDEWKFKPHHLVLSHLTLHSEDDMQKEESLRYMDQNHLVKPLLLSMQSQKYKNQDEQQPLLTLNMLLIQNTQKK